MLSIASLLLSLHSCPTWAQIDTILAGNDAGTFADVGTRADVMADNACTLPGDWATLAGYVDSLSAANGLPCSLLADRTTWDVCHNIEVQDSLADVLEASQDDGDPLACSDTASDLEDECLAPALVVPASLERPASFVVGLSDGASITTRPAVALRGPENYFSLDY